MKIFLDTNVFYNDWFMQSSNFKYLFHFLNNDGHELLLSELVVQEVENIRRRDAHSFLVDLKKLTQRAQKLSSEKIRLDENTIKLEEYELLPLLRGRVEDLELFDYEDISHRDVVDRALAERKPFLKGEKGYRDTLIWMSFLNHLVKLKSDTDDVVFISENKSDFFKFENNTVQFHDDLKDDIEKWGVTSNIRTFTSLADFVNSTIDQNEHAVDRFNSEEIFEEYVEECSAEYIERFSLTNLAEYYEAPIFASKIRNIVEIRVDVWEGIEDAEVMHTSKLDNHDIYIGYRYNLRRVAVEIDISEADYFVNKEELDKLFIDVEVSSEIATLTSIVRPYFDVSFIYNDRDETLKDYEVTELMLRL